jgi:hypothetical protein
MATSANAQHHQHHDQAGQRDTLSAADPIPLAVFHHTLRVEHSLVDTADALRVAEVHPDQEALPTMFLSGTKPQ